jgi:hypothetical protein
MKHSRFAASTGERSDPTRLGRAPLLHRSRFNPPPHLSEPQSKEPRPSAATMRRASGGAGRPRAPSRAPQLPARSAAFTPSARRSRGFAVRGKTCGEPPAPPSFGTARRFASAVQAEWGHGVGRHARQMRGEIVSTGKTLRVRRRARRVQTKMYPLMYQTIAPFLSFQRKRK